MPDRWAFGLLFVGTLTYTVLDVARRVVARTDAGDPMARRQAKLANDTRSSHARASHAHPMTLRERNEHRRSTR
jgi:hypothetical protein